MVPAQDVPLFAREVFELNIIEVILCFAEQRTKNGTQISFEPCIFFKINYYYVEYNSDANLFRLAR
jgi:hypothetical protein